MFQINIKCICPEFKSRRLKILSPWNTKMTTPITVLKVKGILVRTKSNSYGPSKIFVVSVWIRKVKASEPFLDTPVRDLPVRVTVYLLDRSPRNRDGPVFWVSCVMWRRQLRYPSSWLPHVGILRISSTTPTSKSTVIVYMDTSD